MFIGHVSVALAMRPQQKSISLGFWILATMMLDVVWPILLLIGIEKVSIVPGHTVMMPLVLEELSWSHSLLMSFVWGILLGLLVVKITKANRRGLWLICMAVVSHWLLDYITHSPDMPIVPNGKTYGLGLWNHPTFAIVLESTMVAFSIYIYFKGAKTRDRSGRIQFAAMGLLLLFIHLMSIFGPPPPNDQSMIALSSIAMFPVFYWAHRIDKRLYG